MPQPFPLRRPLLFAGLLLLLMLGVLLLTYAVNAIWHEYAIVVIVLGESLLALVAIFMLWRFRWWRIAGLRIPRYSPAIFGLLAPCFILISDANSIAAWWAYIPGRDKALFFLFFAMLVGFVEEVYFRGLILRALLVKGPWVAAIISSVAFGAMHLLHLIEGQNLTATLLQVVSASTTGFLFAAVALRIRSILPLIVIHGLRDFIAFLALNGTEITYTPSSDAVEQVAVEAIIFIILGAIAMRGLGTDEHEPNTEDLRDRTLVESRI